MARFPQRTVSIPSQPSRSCIILHPLGFVFYAQAASRLAITESLFKIQTSTHGLQFSIPVEKSRPNLGRHSSSSDTHNRARLLGWPVRSLHSFTPASALSSPQPHPEYTGC